MKTKNILVLAAMTLSLLASCSSDDDMLQTAQGSDVRFSVGINDTRAFESADDITSFGMYMHYNDNNEQLYGNSKFMGSNATGFTSLGITWKDGARAVNIVAYAPYSETHGTDFEVQGGSGTSADESDIIVAEKKSFVPGSDLVAGKTTLAFTHLMGRLAVSFNLNFAYNVSNVKVSALYTTAHVSLLDAASRIAATGATEEITPELVGTSYMAVLPPQTGSNIEVTFEVYDKSNTSNFRRMKWRGDIEILSNHITNLQLTVNDADLPTRGSETAVEGTVSYTEISNNK